MHPSYIPIKFKPKAASLLVDALLIVNACLLPYRGNLVSKDAAIRLTLSAYLLVEAWFAAVGSSIIRSPTIVVVSVEFFPICICTS